MEEKQIIEDNTSEVATETTNESLVNEQASTNEEVCVAQATALEDEDNEEKEDSEDEAVDNNAAFCLTTPSNMAELAEKMCTKRGRKLIYKPNEVIFERTFKIFGLDGLNDEGISVKDILDAEIKEGLKLGYLDKFDGLKTSEIKEEYENDVVYELADQEFRKMGIICSDDKTKVYVYDWDKKGLHHIGFLQNEDLTDCLKYFNDKEKYSFDLCGIIIGGKSKRVVKDEKGKIKVIKDNGTPISIELDVTIVNRKD